MDYDSENFSPPDAQVPKRTRSVTAEPPSSRPTTPEVNTTASSINQSIVGPAKSHVTKTFAAATKVAKTGARAIALFDSDNTAPSDKTLRRVDKILTSLKTTKNQVDVLEEYIALKFEQPASRNLPNKQQLLLEVLNTIKQDELTTHRQTLGQVIGELEMLLNLVNFKVTPFVPTPVEVLANYHPDQVEEDDSELQHQLPPTTPQAGEVVWQSDNSVRQPARPASHTGIPVHPRSSNVPVQDNNRTEDYIRSQQEIENQQELAGILSTNTPIKRVQLAELKQGKHFLERVNEHHGRVTEAYTQAQNAKRVPTQVSSITRTGAPIASEKPATSQNDIALLSQAILKLGESQAQSNQAILKMSETQAQTASATQELMMNMPRMIVEQLEAYQEEGGSCRSSRISRISRARSIKHRSDGKKVNVDQVSANGEEKRQQQHAYQPPPQEQHTPETPNFNTTPVVQVQNSHDNGLKLDTLLKLCPSYNGTGNLDMFIKQFRETILSIQKISAQQKYLVLATKITGTAKRYLVEHENYEQAIEDTFEGLKNSYGKEDTQQNLLDKLYTLPLNQADVNSMRHDIASHEQVARRLINKGLQVTDERLYHPLLAKLPARAREHMSMFLARQGGIAYYSEVMNEVSILLDSVTHERAFQRCQVQTPVNEIPQTQAMIHVAQASANPNTKGLTSTTRPLAYNPASHATEFHDPITNTTLPGYYAPGSGGPNLTMIPRSFPYTNDEPTTCKACGGKHADVRCPLSSTEFRKLLNKKSLCPICAQKHAIEACRAGFRCGYCSGTHHMGSCPQKEHYRNPANYPAGAKKVQTFFSDPTKQ